MGYWLQSLGERAVMWMSGWRSLPNYAQRNMGRSVAFYRDGLGFKTDCVEESPRVCFFDTPGTKFELYPLDLLAEDICPDDSPTVGGGFGGIALTYNVGRLRGQRSAPSRVDLAASDAKSPESSSMESGSRE